MFSCCVLLCQTVRTVLPGAHMVVISSEHVYGTNQAHQRGVNDMVAHPTTLFGASKGAQEVWAGCGGGAIGV